MNLDFNGKNAIITGSSSGIGFAIAKHMHSRGCKVVINGRNRDKLFDAVNKIPGAYSVDSDVTTPYGAKRLIDEALENIPKLDFLVCNVGSGRSVRPGAEDYDEWGRMFDLNFRSATNVIEVARNYLRKTSGAIVCISSICGCEVIPNAPITYSVSKSALNTYIRGISRPFGLEGVRINGIAAGNIIFEGSVWEEKLTENENRVKEMLKNEVSLGKFGTTNDVAELVAYLCSEHARFVTGAIWTLDGGQIRG